MNNSIANLYQLVEDFEEGVLKRSLIYGVGRLADVETGEFYLKDRAETVKWITDGNGDVTETRRYDVFGAKQ